MSDNLMELSPFVGVLAAEDDIEVIVTAVAINPLRFLVMDKDGNFLVIDPDVSGLYARDADAAWKQIEGHITQERRSLGL